MTEATGMPKGWRQFAGGVLVVAVLYWAQPVVVPVVLAILFTFVLAPVVFALQRFLGRVGAVVLVVVLAFGAVGLPGWAVGQQMTSIVQELPTYRANIRQKIRDVRAVARGGSVDTIKDAVADIQHELDNSPKGSTAAPLVVQSSEVMRADDPELESDVTYYQRLIAGDQAEAAEIIELTAKLLADLTEDDAAAPAPGDESAAPRSTVLGCPLAGDGDAVALRMLARILPESIELKIVAPGMMSSDIIAVVRRDGFRVVCIADLPPSPSTKSRYLVKRLRAALPEVKVVVGRWSPPTLADDSDDALRAAGATVVTSTLLETCRTVSERLPPATVPSAAS